MFNLHGAPKLAILNSLRHVAAFDIRSDEGLPPESHFLKNTVTDSAAFMKKAAESRIFPDLRTSCSYDTELSGQLLDLDSHPSGKWGECEHIIGTHRTETSTRSSFTASSDAAYARTTVARIAS